MHELNELGLLDESAITCMGPLPEYIANCTKPADGEVCRKHDNPFSKVGACAYSMETSPLMAAS